jgi:S1-C subfamily serine protease
MLVGLIAIGMQIGCAGPGHRVDITGNALISPRSQEKIRTVVSSVVGAVAVTDYRLEFFEHELVGGQYVPDATSPTGYRLAKGNHPVAVSQKIQKVNGGGLIIYRDERRTLILTSEHILSSPDTIRTFHRDAAGKETSVLASRAIKRRVTYHVIDQINQMEPAEVLRTDPRADLGLVAVTSSPALGKPFSFNIAYRRDLTWGDLAFVFGYPREMKQLSVGVISPAPYPGAFALDVVARFGFSGGPVFLVQPEGDLELAGVIRGVPISKFQYLSPPPEVAPGQNLTAEELGQIRSEEFDLIEYGTVYAVGAEKIGRFLKESVPMLEKKGIYLPQHLLP